MKLNLIKTLLAIAVMLFVANAMIVSSLSPPGVDVAKELPKFGQNPKNPHIPAIVKLADEKGEPFCTAFVIDANYAMTAGHCVNEGSGRLSKHKMKILSESNEDLKVEAIAAAINNRMDVGLVKGDFNEFKIMQVNFYEFEPLMAPSSYMSCGYPYGHKHLTCVPFAPLTNEGFAIKGVGFLIPGMSGGPTIDLNTGRVIGINIAAGDGGVLLSSPVGALGAFDIEK